MTKVVSGLFDDYVDAQTAVQELESAGFTHSDITIVRNNADLEHSNAADGAGAGALGGVVGGGAVGLLTGLGVMAIPGVGPVVAAGWLAATLAGAAAGAGVGAVSGGLIGSLSKAGVAEEDAHFYAEGVRRGGTLVSVRAEDSKAPVADEILHRLRRADPVQRRQLYVDEGWSRFDETQRPYTAAELAEIRRRSAR